MIWVANKFFFFLILQCRAGEGSEGKLKDLGSYGQTCGCTDMKSQPWRQTGEEVPWGSLASQTHLTNELQVQCEVKSY